MGESIVGPAGKATCSNKVLHLSGPQILLREVGKYVSFSSRSSVVWLCTFAQGSFWPNTNVTGALSGDQLKSRKMGFAAFCPQASVQWQNADRHPCINLPCSVWSTQSIQPIICLGPDCHWSLDTLRYFIFTACCRSFCCPLYRLLFVRTPLSVYLPVFTDILNLLA